jgi:hypothetical protein
MADSMMAAYSVEHMIAGLSLLTRRSDYNNTVALAKLQAVLHKIGELFLFLF